MMRLGERDYRLVRLEERIRCVEAKVAKTSDAPSGFIRWDGREPEEGGLTRRAQTKSARG